MAVACGHCGKQVSERAPRCPFCGELVRRTSAVGPASERGEAPEPTAQPKEATKALDLLRLAQLAQGLEASQARDRARRKRNRWLGAAFGLAAVVAGAILLVPWLESMSALSLLKDMNGGGAAKMAAGRVATDNANVNVADGAPSAGPAESTGPAPDESAKALAERSGSAPPPPADAPPPPAAPQPETQSGAPPAPRPAGAPPPMAKLDDLSKLKRPGAPKANAKPASSAGSAASSASSAAKKDEPEALDTKPWMARGAGFFSGLVIASVLSWGSNAGSAKRDEKLGKRAARQLPTVIVGIVALVFLAREAKLDLRSLFARSPSAPAAGGAPAKPRSRDAKPKPSAAPRKAPGAPSEGAPQSPSAGASLPASANGDAKTATAPASATPAPALSNARPASFAELVARLRERRAAELASAKPFARLRTAVAARKNGKPEPSATAAGAGAAPAPALATPAPAPLAGPKPKPPAPPSAAAEHARTLWQAALHGLIGGLLLGSCGALLWRIVRGGPSPAQAAALVLVVLPSFAPSPARAQDAYTAALASKFVSCYQAEGNPVSDEDRATLDSVASELGGLVPSQAGGALCPDAADGDACTSSMGNLPCDQLAAGLSTSLGVPLTEPPPAEWATSYGKAVSDKVLACLESESGTAPSADDTSLVTGYGGDMSRLADSLTSSGKCTVDSTALASCLQGIAAAACPATLDAVSATMAPAEAQGTGQTENYDEAEAAAEQDAPAMSDDELDQTIDSTAANTKSPVPFFSDVCSAVLKCAQDQQADENAP